MKNNREMLFSSPFSFLYWKTASRELTITKSIVMTSILISLALVFETIGKAVPIYFFDRQVMFVFLPQSLISMLFGPIVGIASGAIIDILGFFIFNPGTLFFPGYTISSMISSLIFALFFYRTRITITKLALAKFLINMVVNAGLGSIWWPIVINNWDIFPVYFAGGLIKNIYLLPLEVLLLYYLYKKIIPISKNEGIISSEIPNKIKWI